LGCCGEGGGAVSDKFGQSVRMTTLPLSFADSVEILVKENRKHFKMKNGNSMSVKYIFFTDIWPINTLPYTNDIKELEKCLTPAMQTFITFWRRNYFFFILEHSVYKI
jgi:hypothetical protein